MQIIGLNLAKDLIQRVNAQSLACFSTVLMFSSNNMRRRSTYIDSIFADLLNISQPWIL